MKQQASPKEQMKTAITIVAAVAEAIRELGSIPSGHLYAQVMGRIDLAAYTKIIGTLKNAGLVAEQNDLLTWVGPVLS
jgi:hypothetical protein